MNQNETLANLFVPVTSDIGEVSPAFLSPSRLQAAEIPADFSTAVRKLTGPLVADLDVCTLHLEARPWASNCPTYPPYMDTPL